ncbi:hypothetical protein BGZ83_008778 [Gryganskiella cystojenkinii]|nr:hypothetical protein BGZ83_008778 [Gryganskiella cystojenkinii]
MNVYDEFVEGGKPGRVSTNYDDKGNFVGITDFSPGIEFGGNQGYLIARPILYEILHSRIPKEKIHHKKRVESITNDVNGVRVECADGSIFEGDILVGADGAYSPVRQGLYKQLKQNNSLPSADDQPLPYNCICLLGQTVPLDPEEYPSLKEEECIYNSMDSINAPYVWATFTTKQNTICWMVVRQLDGNQSKEQETLDNSEWGPEATQTMCKEVAGFVAPVGDGKVKTIGHLIEKTPKDFISKVVFEEKVFKTWYSGRTVLLGDACHKISPSGGLGAVSAIQDAVCLANWLNVLPENTSAAAEKIFDEYRQERFPIIMDAYRSSRLFASCNEQSLKGFIVRYLFKNMPQWLWLILLKKMYSSRPQVSFLPRVEDKGSVPPIPQPSYDKTIVIMEELAAKGKGPMPV